MRNLVSQKYRADMETTRTKATAGPSTPFVAKSAPNSAQDDIFIRKK
jgi:hypothetical protein